MTTLRIHDYTREQRDCSALPPYAVVELARRRGDQSLITPGCRAGRNRCRKWRGSPAPGNIAGRGQGQWGGRWGGSRAERRGQRVTIRTGLYSHSPSADQEWQAGERSAHATVQAPHVAGQLLDLIRHGFVMGRERGEERLYCTDLSISLGFASHLSLPHFLHLSSSRSRHSSSRRQEPQECGQAGEGRGGEGGGYRTPFAHLTPLPSHRTHDLSSCTLNSECTRLAGPTAHSRSACPSTRRSTRRRQEGRHAA